MIPCHSQSWTHHPPPLTRTSGPARHSRPRLSRQRSEPKATCRWTICLDERWLELRYRFILVIYHTYGLCEGSISGGYTSFFSHTHIYIYLFIMYTPISLLTFYASTGQPPSEVLPEVIKNAPAYPVLMRQLPQRNSQGKWSQFLQEATQPALQHRNNTGALNCGIPTAKSLQYMCFWICWKYI